MDNDEKKGYGNDDSDETVFDNKEETQTARFVSSQSRTRPSAKKKTPKWKVATAAGAGILLGGVSTLFAGPLFDNTDPVAEGEGADTADTDATVAESSPAVYTDGEVEVASGVSDDMSFGEAFAAARAEVGAGGVFEWHGNAYNTFYETEWNDMSQAERNDYFSHLDMDNINDDIDMDDTSDPDTETDDWLDDIELAEDGTENDAGATEDNPGFDDDADVEVLGSVPDESGGYEDGDGDVAIIDMNADGQADFIAADLNGDGIISSDELLDITDDGLDPEEFAEMPDDMEAGGDYDNSLAMNDESLFMDDSDMPDYVNDADTTDYDGLV